MNEAMPQWRTFSSDAPSQPGLPGAPGATPPQGGAEGAQQQSGAERAQQHGPSRTMVALVAIGSAAVGAAAVAMIALALGAAPSMGILGATGEPLGIFPATVGVPLGQEATLLADESGPSEDVVVDVAGAVVRPGLQRLSTGDRVGDAIEAAGGFAAQVDLAEAGRALNLALPLTDGDKVLVPELGFERLAPALLDDGLIDLNAADRTLLETLPGIGPVTAGKIVEARADDRFGSVKDLRSRGMVGDAVYSKIKDLVRVSR